MEPFAMGAKSSVSLVELTLDNDPAGRLRHQFKRQRRPRAQLLRATISGARTANLDRAHMADRADKIDVPEMRHAAAFRLVRRRGAFSGKGLPIDCASKRKCARREAGMPFSRQLCTVETGASISRATAEVPPK